MHKHILFLGLLASSLSSYAMRGPACTHDESLIKTGQLLQAAICRASGPLVRLIEEGANPNYRDKNGKSVLLHAAEFAALSRDEIEWESSLAVMEFLLRGKADPNVASIEKVTPLLALVKRARTIRRNNALHELEGAIITLLKYGARLDAKDEFDSTALECVPEESQFEKIRELLTPKKST